MSEKNTITGDAANIRLIQETAVKASKPQLLAIPAERLPSNTVYITKPDGGHEKITLDPKPRDHVFETLAALIAFVKNVIGGKHGEASPVVWCCPNGITVSMDDQTRLGCGNLPLTLTPQFSALARGETATPRSQDEFVQLLRVGLAGTLPADSDLLSRLRKVNFEFGNKGNGSVQHGSESISRDVIAKCQGDKAIPETVTLNVRVFQTPDIQRVVPVTCEIVILPREQQFRMFPRPMECDDAIAVVLHGIEEQLRKDLECPVYRGALECV